jgi:predicted Zn-dependent protease
MKRWIALAGIVSLGIAAVLVSERRNVDVPPGPAALLYLVADTEQELTRMPVRFTRMSDQEEIRIGNDLGNLYRRGEKQDDEAVQVENYLQQVGARLAAHAHRKLPYRFHYVPEKYFINAFALPGGQVYVGEGLMALMDSEDELAAVIGHEIEHIDHYHCAERVQQEQALRKIPFGELAALPIELFEAGYSKDQELEADREGTRLAVEAGYSATGALRMFEIFQRLYDEHHARARTPQEELSQMAEQTLEGYFRSHPLSAERMEQVRQLIASEHWELHPERDLAVAYIFWTARASDALAAGEYSAAQQLASRALKLHPDQTKALEVLAKAQFAQADFPAAAAAYHQILELDPSKMEAAHAYAQSLAAAGGSAAWAEFRQWTESLKGEKPHDLEVPLAGLALLAGDPAPAKNAVAVVRRGASEDWAPDWFARLAWWYYLAGDSSTSLELLENAVQQRPGDSRYATEQGWVQIENRRLADAMQSLNTTYETSNDRPDRVMARAVALWQAKEQEDALRDFATAAARQPEWDNARWVKALYSPLVAESVEQIRAEQKRRQARARR